MPWLKYSRASRSTRPFSPRAYPGEPINEKTVARAIATFERTVVSGQAPFDRWISGDESAIGEDAKRGFDLFNGKAGCVQCHSEWNFTDNGFHDVGLEDSDRGRGERLPLEGMQFAFKTPTLRNVDRRAPYMHEGNEQTLAEVIDFYDRGGDARRKSLSPEMVPLHLTAQEKTDLLAFLSTLTSVDKTGRIPHPSQIKRLTNDHSNQSCTLSVIALADSERASRCWRRTMRSINKTATSLKPKSPSR